MKLSELIAELQEVYAERGDARVLCEVDEGGYVTVDVDSVGYHPRTDEYDEPIVVLTN